MEQIVEYLPFLLPFLIAEMILMITALVHVLKHPRYKFGNRTLWVIIVLFVQIIGPIVYFALGRGEE